MTINSVWGQTDRPVEFVWEERYNTGKSGIAKSIAGQTSSFIPVSPGDLIEYKILARGNWAALAFYDENQQWIQSMNESTWMNDRPFPEQDYCAGVVTVPEGCAFVRISRFKPSYTGKYVLTDQVKSQYVWFHDGNQFGWQMPRQKEMTPAKMDLLTELSPENDGVVNMVKNAYQMARIKWTPIQDVAYNSGVFPALQEVEGLPYSSVKEIYTFVPQYVSYETFLTAVHNPRSRLYTERLDEAPYHGGNCRTYYGGVCSSLVSYACGFPFILNSSEYEMEPELFERVGDGYDAEAIEVGDILQSYELGHVMLVSKVWIDENGHRKLFEITEENGTKAVSMEWDRSFVDEWLSKHTYLVLRYKKREKVQYKDQVRFVTLEGETPRPYQYNEFICPDRGNKALYLEKDSVVLNLFVEDPVNVKVYRGRHLYQIVKGVSGDVNLGQLPAGTYRAKVKAGNAKYGPPVTFKVINVSYSIDEANNRIYFSSQNAVPKIIRFCTQSGANVTPTGKQNNFITKEELKQGYKEFGFSFKDNPKLYFQIHCWDEKDQYGKIVTRNVRLRDGMESP